MPFPEFDSKGMEYRFLGNTGLLVSAIAFGSWYTVGGQVKDSSVIEKCMEEAWNCGINFFDTSESYAEGQAEIEMGNAIKKFGWSRKDFIISTKIFEGGVRRIAAYLGTSVRIANNLHRTALMTLVFPGRRSWSQ
jgi:Predicted oxidoreductases (related to aryl-alcohol dehydrogenases)